MRVMIVALCVVLTACHVVEGAKWEAAATEAAARAAAPMQVKSSLSGGRDTLLLSLVGPAGAAFRDSISVLPDVERAACAATGVLPAGSVRSVLLLVWQPAAGAGAVPLGFAFEAGVLAERCALLGAPPPLGT